MQINTFYDLSFFVYFLKKLNKFKTLKSLNIFNTRKKAIFKAF